MSRWSGWTIVAVLAVTGCQPSPAAKRSQLDALLKSPRVTKPLATDEVALLKEVGLVERKWDVLQWCAANYSNGHAAACKDIHHSLWTAGDEQARRAFANHACVNPVNAPQFWTDQDAAVRVVLDRSQTCAGLQGLPFPKLLESLDRIEPGQISVEPLASRLPAPAAGGDCVKESVAWLPLPATPGRAKLAGALLRRGCPDYLERLVGEHRTVFDGYRRAIESALAAPRRNTHLALTGLPAELAVVQRRAAVFSADLPRRMHDALRQSTWFPAAWPTEADLAAISAALGKNAALAAAVLDYLEKNSASWPEPQGNLLRESKMRQHLLSCLGVAEKVRVLQRPALAARLAAPAEKAFRAEVDRLAGLSPDDIVRFLNSGEENPFIGDLLDRLTASAGHPVLAVSGQAMLDDVRKRIDETLRGKMLVVKCTGAVCERLPHRVKVGYRSSFNDYCYDKYFLGYGACTNRGQRLTLSLTYTKDARPAGSVTIVGETPQRVTYQRHTAGIDLGPSSSDLESAADSDLRAKFAAANLRLPY
jgi:hypothetical protein